MFTDIAEITKIEDVLVTKYKANALISEEEAQLIDQAHITLASGQDMFIIVDFRNEGVSILDGAKDYFLHKGKMMPYTKAVAILGDIKSRGLLHKLLGRSKTWYEVRKFGSAEEAHQWFAELRKNEKIVA